MNKFTSAFGCSLITQAHIGAFLLMLSLLLIASARSAPVRADAAKESALSPYWQEDGKNYNIACENGSKFEKINENELSLKSGSFLIESEDNISLDTSVCVLHMKPKSMVLVKVQADSKRIFSLLESSTVVRGNEAFALNYGEEALLQDHMFNTQKKDLQGETDVAVRRTLVHDLGDNWKMATMEFNLLHAVEREPLLNQISHSKHPHDRFLREKLLKSAAVINMVTNGHGPYQ